MNDVWLNVLSNAVSVISGVILAGVSGLGAFYVSKYTNRMKRKSFMEDVETYVRGVEQSPLYGSLSGIKKFEKVKNFAERKAKEYKIDLPEDEVDIIIESKVQLMHSDVEKLAKMIEENDEPLEKQEIIEDSSSLNTNKETIKAEG